MLRTDTYYIIKQFDKKILKMLFDFDKEAPWFRILGNKKLFQRRTYTKTQWPLWKIVLCFRAFLHFALVSSLTSNIERSRHSWRTSKTTKSKQRCRLTLHAGEWRKKLEPRKLRLWCYTDKKATDLLQGVNCTKLLPSSNRFITFIKLQQAF